MVLVADSVQLVQQSLTREPLEGFGCFKIGQVILVVKYADDLLLLAQEETVLQGVIDRLNEITVEMNVEKTIVMRI
jgi:hypothetical protein